MTATLGTRDCCLVARSGPLGSAKRAILSRRLPTGWTLTRMGDVVKLVSNSVKVEAATEYKMAGVKGYGEGVFHREVES